MKTLKLYHGSQIIVEKPLFGYGKTYNDYGQGFYCTEHIELAKEWACSINQDGFVNEYELDMSNLSVLNFSSDEFHILNWLAILLDNRLVNLSSPVSIRARKYLLDNFLPDYKKYDVIVGYRADDSYFLFARSFINNEISLKQLSYAMKLGKLGEQFCLKSEKAFNQIRFVKAEVVQSAKYHFLKKQRDEKARSDYIKELENDDIDGIYIRDIIREGYKNGDQRLR